MSSVTPRRGKCFKLSEGHRRRLPRHRWPHRPHRLAPGSRGRQPIYDGGLATLRRFTDDVKEVRTGLECGIKLGDFNEYEVGDIIECYQLEAVPQKLRVAQQRRSRRSFIHAPDRAWAATINETSITPRKRTS